MTSTSPVDLTALPTAIGAYLAAHAARDADAFERLFTPDATVTDEGRAHHGIEAIQRWRRTASSQYTYTARLTGAERTDSAHAVVTQHLEGDFPGGVVDLRFRFTLDGDRIADLTIAP
ncbi:nuclear transport factor 2 family protein [Nakamurella leprariae]|uniref:Nuclear transport factor 2 family protein n=1 Tax=Nakamurella leprariae TaxID=2803911 RepID=A0A938YII2_9ACTN|nr:nuclear transport factor 2 family protein [Nakamurella leprariae]MBM9468410.1 nuclear transport factor 2 family protein [Nakamurella leprariae]